MRTTAPSPQYPDHQVMLLPGTGASDVLCPGSCCGRLEQEGTSVGGRAWTSVMVQFLLLAGPMAGMLSQCGWYREAPSPWLQLGTAGDFVNRPLPSAQGRTLPFISIRTRSLSDQQGAEVGPRSRALGVMRDLRPRDCSLRCPHV